LCRNVRIPFLRGIVPREERQRVKYTDHELIEEAKEHECGEQMPRSGALRRIWRSTGAGSWLPGKPLAVIVSALVWRLGGRPRGAV
jgi:hypothetical protein